MGKVFVDGQYLKLYNKELIFSETVGKMLAYDLGGEFHNINEFTYSI